MNWRMGNHVSEKRFYEKRFYILKMIKQRLRWVNRTVTARQVLSPLLRAAFGRACAASSDVPDLSRLAPSERAPTQLWFSELASLAWMLRTWTSSSSSSQEPSLSLSSHCSPSTVSLVSCGVLTGLRGLLPRLGLLTRARASPCPLAWARATFSSSPSLVVVTSATAHDPPVCPGAVQLVPSRLWSSPQPLVLANLMWTGSAPLGSLARQVTARQVQSLPHHDARAWVCAARCDALESY
jgi:hypothetical protein